MFLQVIKLLNPFFSRPYKNTFKEISNKPINPTYKKIFDSFLIKNQVICLKIKIILLNLILI